MSTQKTLKTLCLILGIAYVVLIGFLKVGYNFQATFFHFSFFLVLGYLSKSRGIKLSLYHYAIFLLGLLLSIFFSITTNSLVIVMTYLVVWFLTCTLLLLAFEKHIPDGPIQYIESLFRYCKYVIVNGLSVTKIKQFLTVKREGMNLNLNKDIVYGLFFSIFILAVFHLLFSQVNADYSKFMGNILGWIWHAIRYVIDIDLLWVVLKGVIQGYFLYVLLSVEHTKEGEKLVSADWPVAIFKMALISVVALFLIFSSFQSRQLLLDIFHLEFKEVSQYVQKGFIELIIVTFAGYVLSIRVLERLSKDTPSDQAHIQWLLSVFCIELVAITIFIFHKLYALQAVFGFKDQRMIASGAVLLILSTFILLLFRIWGKISSVQLFRGQILLLTSLVILFNLVNIDSFISKYNSIRLYSDNKQYKDYSYLLGNSYDNVSDWPTLMKEAQEIGIPKPDKSYYWGHFSTGRKDFYGSSYSPICEGNSDINRLINSIGTRSSYDNQYYSYLENRYKLLANKYNSFNLETPLNQLTTVNLREYQAYLFIRENKEMVDSFIQFAISRCKA